MADLERLPLVLKLKPFEATKAREHVAPYMAKSLTDTRVAPRREAGFLDGKHERTFAKAFEIGAVDGRAHVVLVRRGSNYIIKMLLPKYHVQYTGWGGYEKILDLRRQA